MKYQFFPILIGMFVLASGSLQSKEKEVVYLGVASNFSDVMVNSYNPFGSGVRNGVELALKTINPELEKKGIEIRSREFNYGGNKLNIKSIVQRAAASDVVAVVGYEFSDDALLAAPWHQKFCLPMITPSASADRLEAFNAFVHQGTFNNSYQGKILARFVIQKLKLNRAVIITAADCAYCQDLTSAVSNQFEKFGGQIVKKILFLSEERNFDKIIRQIDQKSFDVIILPNHELASMRLIIALLQSGINKPMLGGDGWRTLGKDFFGSHLSKRFLGYMIAHWDPSLQTALSAQFVKHYVKEYGFKPTDSAALAYDSTLIIGEIVKKLNKIDRATVEEAFKNLKYFRGTTGQFIFVPGHAPQKSILFMKATPTGFVVDKIIEPGK